MTTQYVDHVLTIESVQINSTDGDGRIFGEIYIDYVLGRSGLEKIYRRSINYPETRLAGDFLTLANGPQGTGTNLWTLYVSLYDGDDLHDIAVAQVHNYPVTSSRLHETIMGEYGSVSMRYCYLSRAVGARVEIVTVLELGERVFGAVRARPFLEGGLEDDDDDTGMILFSRSALDAVAVLPGGAIPLDRSLVAIPRQSHVRIEVELRRAADGQLIVSGWVGHPCQYPSVRLTLKYGYRSTCL